MNLSFFLKLETTTTTAAVDILKYLNLVNKKAGIWGIMCTFARRFNILI